MKTSLHGEERTTDAVVRNLGIIGEAMKQLPADRNLATAVNPKPDGPTTEAQRTPSGDAEDRSTG